MSKIKRYTPDEFIDYMEARKDKDKCIVFFDNSKIMYSKQTIKEIEFKVMCTDNVLIEIEFDSQNPFTFFIEKRNPKLSKTKMINAYLNSEEEDVNE